MGLHEKTNSQGRFLSIKHGAICMESDTEREGYEFKEGEVNGRPWSKWIKSFGALDGRVTKIEWYKREHEGTTFMGLHLHLRDGDETFVLDLPFGKRPYDYFMKVMDNIDFAKPIECNAWLDLKAKRAPNGNYPTAFVIKQDGEFVKWAYTRDNPGECPVPEQDEFGKWDFRKQREWLYRRLVNVIIPKVEALNQTEYSGIEDDEFAPDNSVEPPFDDDTEIAF